MLNRYSFNSSPGSTIFQYHRQNTGSWNQEKWKTLPNSDISNFISFSSIRYFSLSKNEEFGIPVNKLTLYSNTTGLSFGIQTERTKWSTVRGGPW